MSVISAQIVQFFLGTISVLYVSNAGHLCCAGIPLFPTEKIDLILVKEEVPRSPVRRHLYGSLKSELRQLSSLHKFNFVGIPNLVLCFGDHLTFTVL